MKQAGHGGNEWERLSLDDEFVNAALVSEPSADERRSEATRKRFEAEAISEKLARKASIKRARRVRRKIKARQVGIATAWIVVRSLG